MKNFSIILSVIAVILASFSLLNGCKISGVKGNSIVQLSGGQVSEEELATMLKKNPKMIVDALEAYQLQLQEEAEREQQEAVAKYADEINGTENAPTFGPADAKVTVVEFFDFSCIYCKKLAPTMEKIMADNPDVKFVIKTLTFLTPLSPYQAKAGFAAHKQNKFIDFYKKVMDSKEVMDKKAVDKVAEDLGLDMEKYKADVDSTEIADDLGEIAVLSQKIHIRGVPSVFVNGKPVQSYNAEDFQAEINSVK